MGLKMGAFTAQLIYKFDIKQSGRFSFKMQHQGSNLLGRESVISLTSTETVLMF